VAGTTRELATRALRAHAPELLEADIVELGRGLDNAAYAAGDLVLRVSYGGSVGREARLLEAVASAPLNILHVCGDRSRVLGLAAYPHVAAVSWNAHGAGNPPLSELHGRIAVGGISDAALLDPDVSQVRDEVRAGLAATRGKRWIVAGGCTISPESNELCIRAARDELLASA